MEHILGLFLQLKYNFTLVIEIKDNHEVGFYLLLFCENDWDSLLIQALLKVTHG